MRVPPNTIPVLLAIAALTAGPDMSHAAELSVRLQDPPGSGTIALALFDSANAFGDLRNPTYLQTFPLDGRETYQMQGIPAGEYALLAYYDENDNLKMDRNFIGIPVEPLAFSNNYQPKGPPSYSRAAFQLTDVEPREFTVNLYRPLGERGQWGVGLGAIGRSSPYRDYNGAVTRVIPAITYTGDRLQILGPAISFGLVGTGKVRLAASGNYRIGVYEEDDSDYLAGMGDRDDAFMAGLALRMELPKGFNVSLSYRHDVLNTIGGGEARGSLDKAFQLGTLRFSPEVGVNWLAEDLANHDFGVPEDKALPGRPAYQLNSSYSVDVGIGMLYEITTEWLVVMNIAAEFFESGITDSPIVEEDYVLKGFFAINYLF